MDGETKRKLREMNAGEPLEAINTQDETLSISLTFEERVRLVVRDAYSTFTHSKVAGLVWRGAYAIRTRISAASTCSTSVVGPPLAVQCLCNSWLVFIRPVFPVALRRHAVQGSVGPFMTVYSFPFLGQILRFGHAVHDFSGELFSSESGVEGFDEAVLPR
ncbi:hypothetical protein H4V95_002099 [Arthrobacter sp. CAN_C5]|nr:hypothetical protein [Arthrobacter sp. CAN_C5]